MLIKTRGIVFRTVKYGETSVITDIYTEERGLQSYILHGVRTKKPKFHSGLLQPMSLLELVVYAREGKELQHVKELKSAYPFCSIPFTLLKGAVGSFILELSQKSVKESESSPELFRFLFDTFVFLDQTNQPVVNTHLIFMVKLAAFLGIMPQAEMQPPDLCFDIRSGVFTTKMQVHQYYMDKRESEILLQLLQAPFHESHLIRLTTEERRKFLHDMVKFYAFHVPDFKELQSFSILQTVLS